MGKDHIDVSIIIPVYNVEAYIVDCLESVGKNCLRLINPIRDGFLTCECILVDDCGKDDSVVLAEDYIKQKLPLINSELSANTFILKHDQNKGLSAARNTGLMAASGEYVYFLDSDDTITPNCIEKLWQLVEKYPGVDVVQSSFYSKTEEADIPNTFPFEYSDNRRYIKNLLLTFDGDIIKAQNRLVKKSLIMDNNLFFKENIIHEDNHWTYFLAKHVTTMAFCNTRTYYHRYNPTSITGNRNISKEIKAYRTLIKDFCSDITPFLRGRQKELILETLLLVERANYFENSSDFKMLENMFLEHNNYGERMLYGLYKVLNDGVIKTKVLHLLIRIYKFKD